MESRLELLYFGLVLIGFAVVLYRLIAPTLVKKFDDGGAFATSQVTAGVHEITGGCVAVGRLIEDSISRVVKKLKKTEDEVARCDLRKKMQFYMSPSFSGDVRHRILTIGRLIQKEFDESDSAKFTKAELSIVRLWMAHKSQKTQSPREVELCYEISRVLRNSRSNLGFLSSKESIGYDIFRLQFALNNCSLFWPRLGIVAILFLGILAASIPNLLTTLFVACKIKGFV